MLALSLVTLEFHGCCKAFPPGVAEEAQRVKRAQLDLRDGCPTTVRHCYHYAHSLTTAFLREERGEESGGGLSPPKGVVCNPASQMGLQVPAPGTVLIFKERQTFHWQCLNFSFQALPEVTI